MAGSEVVIPCGVRPLEINRAIGIRNPAGASLAVYNGGQAEQRPREGIAVLVNLLDQAALKLLDLCLIDDGAAAVDRCRVCR